MDKVVGWLVLAVSLVIVNIIGDLIEPMGGDNVEMKNVWLFIFAAIAMAGQDMDGDNWINRIISGVLGFLPALAGITIALAVYIAVLMMMEGGFDMMGLVYSIGFIAVTLATSSLVIASLKNAVKG